MGANPHANGGAAAAGRCACRISRAIAVAVPQPGATRGRGDAGARRLPSRRDARSTTRPAQLPPRRARRDRLQPARRRVRASRSAPGWADPCRTTTDLAPDGRVMEILSEHICQGWLEGYLLTGRHGLFSCYEAFIHIVDSMFNQHAKWLKVSADSAVAPADRVAQLPADLACLAPGPQRLLAPGPGLHRPRGRTRRPTSSASTCRRTPTACCTSPTTACAAGTSST